MSETVVYNRKNPFPSKLEVNRKLTLEGSEKDTRHFELSLAGSGLKYEVGDSLGVFPKNNPELVSLVLKRLGFSGDEEVPGNDGNPKPLREALTSDYILSEPARQLLLALAEKDTSAAHLKDLADPKIKTEYDKFIWGRDVLDMLEDYPSVTFTPEEFIKALRKLQPRLYSIASSQKAHPDSVHLTVACVRYQVPHSPRPREGVCSTYLADRVGTDDRVLVFVHTAKHFRVPEDPAAPIIMVGPGTGIAPFRAFLQERQATGATGKNWLFFGEQRSKCDFFYKEEFEALQAAGVLTTLTTAFSRDQEHKIYVQHRMKEHGAELWKWLEEGAYFYVCGDAHRMAVDVDRALHEIVEEHGGKTPEQAQEYIEELKKSKRYRKDVY